MEAHTSPALCTSALSPPAAGLRGAVLVSGSAWPSTMWRSVSGFFDMSVEYG